MGSLALKVTTSGTGVLPVPRAPVARSAFGADTDGGVVSTGGAGVAGGAGWVGVPAGRHR